MSCGHVSSTRLDASRGQTKSVVSILFFKLDSDSLLSLPVMHLSPIAVSCVLLLVGAHALPLGSPSSPAAASAASSPLTYSLVLLPFPLLALLKYVYVRHRKSQSIHDSGKLGISASPSHLSRHLSPRVRSGFLIGFLGSPSWETRIKCTIDSTTRKELVRQRSLASSKPSSAVIYSRILGDSSASRSATLARSAYTRSESQSASLAPSVFRPGEGPSVDIHNCAIVHPSSPACPSDLPFISRPGPTRAPFKRAVVLDSPTLMQIMEPVIASSFAANARIDDVEPDHDKSGSSSANSTLRWQRRSKSSSASLVLLIFPSFCAGLTAHVPQRLPSTHRPHLRSPLRRLVSRSLTLTASARASPYPSPPRPLC